MQVTRLPDNPIIKPDMVCSDRPNVNGPSVIRVPDWLPNPLGRYYLYFAHHSGDHIRLAYSDRIAGPWTVYKAGTLQRSQTRSRSHIASPDVHVDDDRREIRMYFHGPVTDHGQVSMVALSNDGIHFDARPEILGSFYFRVFQWDGWHYALGMPGILYRSRDGLTDFRQGPTLFGENMRHSALKLDGDVLSVFYSNAGDCPERILLSTMRLTDDWMQWRASDPVKVLEPEEDYEGADLPLEPSVRGPSYVPVRQLRDPAIYRESDRTWLLYSVAGESGIALAEITE